MANGETRQIKDAKCLNRIVTVACVVHAEGKFLVVEETINGKALWNQPAGHLEADETLVEAAARELWEETGISAQPQHFIRMHQWIAPDKTPFCVSSLPLSLSKYARRSLMTAISTAAVGSAPKKFYRRQIFVRRWWRKVFVVIKAGNAIRWR